jgi:hypothetical protein
MTQEGALIVEAAYKAIEQASVHPTASLLNTSERIKVEVNQSADLTTGASTTRRSLIESTMGATLEAFVDCT